jgi:hypothetical protein
LRKHLADHHGNTWRKIVVLEQLKGWELYHVDGSVREQPSKSGAGTQEREKFTLEGFLERLLRFLVVDDQASTQDSLLSLRTECDVC